MSGTDHPGADGWKMDSSAFDVLLIEDDEGDATLLRATLQAYAHTDPLAFELRVAQTLAEARQLLDARRFDVALLDLQLPDAQGLEALEELASSYPGLPIVVLTGLADRDLGRRAMQRGAQDYLVKGEEDGRALRTRIAFAVQRHALQTERAEAQRLVQRRARQLEEANEQLASANRLRERLIETVSHELRTPLTPILGFAELAARDPAAPPHLSAMLGVIQRNAERLLRRVDDLLAVGRASQGQLAPDRRPVELGSVLGSVWDALADLEAEVSVCGSTDQEVVVDPEHLTRILENLIRNASKYGRPPIVLEARIVGDRLSVTVSDHGDGIPAGFVERMWEPFSQSAPDSSSPASGVGLGLTIVRELASANHLELTYDPTGPGATFRLLLPLASADRSERSETEPARREPPVPRVEVLGHTALVYDDPSFLAGSVADFLEEGLRREEGAIVVTTPANQAAFEAALAERGIDLREASREGQVLLLDAARTLELVRPSGVLDEVLCHATLSELLDLAGRGGRTVRIYGDLVSLLWKEGDLISALRIEELCNEVRQRRPFLLHCGLHLPTDDDALHADLRAELRAQHEAVRCQPGDARRQPPAGGELRLDVRLSYEGDRVVAALPTPDGRWIATTARAEDELRPLVTALASVVHHRPESEITVRLRPAELASPEPGPGRPATDVADQDLPGGSLRPSGAAVEGR